MLGSEKGTFANCTDIIVNLLKAYKMTVVGIECDDATFYFHFKKSAPEIVHLILHPGHILHHFTTVNSITSTLKDTV